MNAVKEAAKIKDVLGLTHDGAALYGDIANMVANNRTRIRAHMPDNRTQLVEIIWYYPWRVPNKKSTTSLEQISRRLPTLKLDEVGSNIIFELATRIIMAIIVDLLETEQEVSTKPII